VALARKLRQGFAEGFQSLIPEALIRAQSNSDLETMAGKDVRQEVLHSAFKASGRFLGPWKITHGKPPTAPSNPRLGYEQYACQGSSVLVRRTGGGMTAACASRRHASDFNPGFVTFVGYGAVEYGRQLQNGYGWHRGFKEELESNVP
jgi:hypothetical protein